MNHATPVYHDTSSLLSSQHHLENCFWTFVGILYYGIYHIYQGAACTQISWNPVRPEHPFRLWNPVVLCAKSQHDNWAFTLRYGQTRFREIWFWDAFRMDVSYGNSPRAPFSDDILQRNSELMKISSYSHPNSNKVITTKLCMFRSRGGNGLTHSSMVTYMCQWNGSSFRQRLVTCSAPSHCLSQCWCIVNQSLYTNFRENFNENNKKKIIHENTI